MQDDAAPDLERRAAILLTGRPGIGKTTVIQQTISRLGADRAGGFYTRELRRAGRRIGFEIVTLKGERGLLATTDPDAVTGGVPFGRYRVNRTAIEQIAVPALRRAWQAGKVVILDEIGPMEILSPVFCDVVWTLLEEQAHILGTIVQRPYRFADDVKRHQAVAIVNVTVDNRDSLPPALATRLGKEADSP